MIKKCKICGQEFNAISSNHLYCDNCRYGKCSQCGKRFLIKPKAKKIQKFCSKECHNKSLIGRKLSKDVIAKIANANRGRKTGEFVKCAECGNVVYKYPRDMDRKRGVRKFCSRECFVKFKKRDASPKRNNKGKEKKWKINVYKKDDYTCWICGQKGKDLEAHHLKSWSKYPKLRFDINNGMTLCKFCHKIYTDYGVN